MEHISIEAEVLSRFWKRQILWQWHFGQFDGSEQYSKHQLTNYLKFISLLRFDSSITIPSSLWLAGIVIEESASEKKNAPGCHCQADPGAKFFRNEHFDCTCCECFQHQFGHHCNVPRDNTMKARENRARRHAASRGYILQKNPARLDRSVGFGLYRAYPSTQTATDSLFELTLDDVEKWLRSAPTASPRKTRFRYDKALHVGGRQAAPNIPDHSVLSALAGTNRELMREVAALWIRPEDVVLDATYGRGAFWDDGSELPTIKHDLALDGVDLRHLPERDSSVDVVVLDPPYRPTHGGDSSGVYTAYRVHESGLDSISDVLDLYEAGIVEAHRVLRPGGRIMIKCADLSYSNRLHLVHVDLLRMMHEHGFELADHFVLVNSTRLAASSDRQNRARRAHSYLLVGVL